MPRIRDYEMYSSGPGHATRRYGTPKPWILRIRARSLAEAQSLAESQTPINDETGVGIWQLDHSLGPGTPFSFSDRLRALLPSWWSKS